MALIVWVLAALLCHAAADLASQSCNVDSSATIQPRAEAIVGGIIGVREQGTNGYGCGVPTGSKFSIWLAVVFLLLLLFFTANF